MKGVYSHAWLQSFFPQPLPSPSEISEGLLKHSFEVEDVRTVGTDTVYVLDVLPNRSADCLAHYGIAKEVSALFSFPLKERYFSELFSFGADAPYIQTDKCDRYSIVKVSDVSVPSALSEEIRSRLEAVGQKSISPIVDLSNYILFDIGQPIHVFDARKVSGTFGVRSARDGETLVLLGGEERSLVPADIVITDNDRPVALAGVKGGEDTKVDESTTEVFVEIASFDSTSVRHSARRHRCVSDAAARFSQGFPPELIDYTAQRVAAVFSSCGTVGESFDCRRVPLSRPRMTGVSVSEVNALLGTSYTERDIAGVFDRLGFTYELVDPRDRFVVAAQEQIGKPYMWGASVSRDAPDCFDCSSLVSWCAARSGVSMPRVSINQYLSSRPVAEPRSGDLVFSRSDDSALQVHTESVFEAGCPVSPGSVSDGVNHVGIIAGDAVIEAKGGSEGAVRQVPLSSVSVVYAASIFSDEKRFVVSVPVERVDMRGGADVIEEIARVIGYDTVPVAVPVSSSPAEVNERYAKRLAVLRILGKIGFSEVLSHSFRSKGAVCVSYPAAKDKGCLRTDLRMGMRDALEQNAYNGELLGLMDVRLVEIGAVFTSAGEEVRIALGVAPVPNRSAINVSLIEAEIRSALDLPGSFEDDGVWEVPFSEVTCPVSSYDFLPLIGEVSYVPPSRYPFVLRDIALFVPDGLSVGEVASRIQEHGGDVLRRVNLFDEFEKNGRVSYAFRLVFQSDTDTLTDAVINGYMARVCDALEAQGFEVR